MPAAVTSSTRRARVTRELSGEAARTKILAKLAKAGAKGAASLYSAKVSVGDRVVFAAALAELEAEEQVFVDRRKPKPKFFAFAARPVFPTPESVAAELADLVATRFPLLTSAEDCRKQLSKAQAAHLATALALLVAEQRLILLTLRTGKKETPLYVSAEPLRSALETKAGEPLSFAQAYAALAARTGFPAVSISELGPRSRQRFAAPAPLATGRAPRRARRPFPGRLVAGE